MPKQIDIDHTKIWKTLRKYHPHGLTHQRVWNKMPDEVNIGLDTMPVVLAAMQEKGLVCFDGKRWHAVKTEQAEKEKDYTPSLFGHATQEARRGK
jgi:hypothetical protein